MFLAGTLRATSCSEPIACESKSPDVNNYSCGASARSHPPQATVTLTLPSVLVVDEVRRPVKAALQVSHRRILCRNGGLANANEVGWASAHHLKASAAECHNRAAQPTPFAPMVRLKLIRQRPSHVRHEFSPELLQAARSIPLNPSGPNARRANRKSYCVCKFIQNSALLPK